MGYQTRPTISTVSHMTHTRCYMLRFFAWMTGMWPLNLKWHSSDMQVLRAMAIEVIGFNPCQQHRTHFTPYPHIEPNLPNHCACPESVAELRLGRRALMPRYPQFWPTPTHHQHGSVRQQAMTDETLHARGCPPQEEPTLQAAQQPAPSNFFLNHHAPATHGRKVSGTLDA